MYVNIQCQCELLHVHDMSSYNAAIIITSPLLPVHRILKVLFSIKFLKIKFTFLFSVKRSLVFILTAMVGETNNKKSKQVNS